MNQDISPHKDDKRKILIIDDDPALLLGLQTFLINLGYNVTTAEDGKQALKIFQEEYFPIILSDYQMPNMTGLELVREIKKLGYKPLFLILTAVSEVSQVVAIMKQGVYDYISKPPDFDTLALKIERAFEVSELRSIKESLAQEQIYRTEKQLAWNRWKEDVRSRDITKTDSFLFYNLKTSLSQGAGFGSLLALISFISQQIKEVDGHYSINQKTMNLLRASADTCKKVLEMFSEIYDIIDKELSLNPITMQEFYQMLQTTKADMKRFTKLKNQNIKISDLKSDLSQLQVMVEPKFLKKALEELIINACKFSLADSDIIFLFNSDNLNVTMSIINTPMGLRLDEKDILGIEEGYQRLIFEPFFRLTKHVDEQYESLDFGLGLTLVSKLMQKLNGRVTANNVKFHTSNNPSDDIRVNIELEFPIHR
ncbi:MAG: response regulator [Spirochaetota bacterium]